MDYGDYKKIYVIIIIYVYIYFTDKKEYNKSIIDMKQMGIID